MKPIFSAEEIPAYHEKLLVVRLQPQAQPSLAAMGGARGAAPPESPGLSALAMFERGGMIKRVTPVSRQAAQRAVSGAHRAMASFTASLETPRGKNDGVGTGVSMIELERDADLIELQKALAHDPHVEFVSRIPRRYLFVKGTRGAADYSVAAGAPSPSKLWNLEKVQWTKARALPGFKDAQSIKVAVLDSGIDQHHPDLKGLIGGYAYANPDLSRPSGPGDIVGHGTHVAGTITAKINNQVGINGICQCDLRAWKIFDDIADFFGYSYGYTYFVDPMMYFRALADCIEQKVDVVNLSIGGGGSPDQFELSLYEQLLANGTTVVAAMGNQREQGSPTSYPAAIPGVIAVGATKVNDKIAGFSNRGNHITISAPGVGIWSTLPTTPGQFGFKAEKGPNGWPREGKPFKRETDYDSWEGTSMATPHVTAAVALLLANRGKMSPDQVRNQLIKSAVKVGKMDKKPFHPDFGYGRLDLLRLLTM